MKSIAQYAMAVMMVSYLASALRGLRSSKFETNTSEAFAWTRFC